MSLQAITTPGDVERRASYSLALSASLGAAVLFFSGAASAFTIETSVTAGCHEEITASALRAVRARGPSAPPMVPDRDDLALINDLPFTIDEDLRDTASATLLLGARDNDIKGYGVFSIDEISQVQGAPLAQHEHCLRRAERDSNARVSGGRTGTFLQQDFEKLWLRLR